MTGNGDAKAVEDHVAEIMLDPSAAPDENCELCQSGIYLGAWERFGVTDPFSTDDEIRPKAHKVFVFERAGWPHIEMVTDERPLTRMTLRLLPDEARGIAQALNDAADATEELSDKDQSVADRWFAPSTIGPQGAGGGDAS